MVSPQLPPTQEKKNCTSFTVEQRSLIKGPACCVPLCAGRVVHEGGDQLPLPSVESLCLQAPAPAAVKCRCCSIHQCAVHW